MNARHFSIIRMSYHPHMSHPQKLRDQAKLLRANGWTHREIARELSIGTGTAQTWTKDVILRSDQRQAIMERRNVHRMSAAERVIVANRLAKHRISFSEEEWLQKIKDFCTKHGRMPLKREFNAWHSFARLFGSWNNAIRLAGLEPNPVLFARHFTARDGHTCHSFTEKVIDDWFHEQGIAHERNVRYGDTKYTADFRIGARTLVEFLGLRVRRSSMIGTSS